MIDWAVVGVGFVVLSLVVVSIMGIGYLIEKGITLVIEMKQEINKVSNFF
jgi:Na+-transporting methylmalonyl-CoA/oxaloacetate decarboxylase gamma subunit